MDPETNQGVEKLYQEFKTDGQSSKTLPDGRFTYNFHRMSQTSCKTNSVRDIHRLTPKQERKTKRILKKKLAKLDRKYYVILGGKEVLYPPEVQEQLNNTSDNVEHVEVNGYTYKIDLTERTQTNIQTKKVRSIGWFNREDRQEDRQDHQGDRQDRQEGRKENRRYYVLLQGEKKYYPEDVQQKLNSTNENTIEIRTNGYLYQVDLTNKTQINNSTGKQRTIGWDDLENEFMEEPNVYCEVEAEAKGEAEGEETKAGAEGEAVD